MFRPASRIIARSTAVRALPRAGAPAKRFISTAPPTQKSRSWKSSAVRWAAAGGIIYYYQTSDIFAEEPTYSVQQLPVAEDENEQLPTIEVLAQQRQQKKAATEAAIAASTPSPTAREAPAANEPSQETREAGGVEGLEEEAEQQGAFNPETGEINWDCPCLGGMAHGPCGEEFKAAFSCFVYSTEEPKGMDCIEKFKGMQNCFREYPEIYGAELDPDADDEAAEGNEIVAADRDQAAPIQHETSISSTPDSTPSLQPAKHDAEKVVHKEQPPAPEHELKAKQERARSATEQVKNDHEPHSESEDAVPKAWHDASDSPASEKK